MLLLLACGCDSRSPVEVYNDERQALEYLYTSRDRSSARMMVNAGADSQSREGQKFQDETAYHDQLNRAIRMQEDRVGKAHEALFGK